jgi:hypothetical protein
MRTRRPSPAMSMSGSTTSWGTGRCRRAGSRRPGDHHSSARRDGHPAVPGVYYMAFVLDNATGQVNRATTPAAVARSCGAKEMASAYPLPATATFAGCTTAYQPAMSVHTMSAGRYERSDVRHAAVRRHVLPVVGRAVRRGRAGAPTYASGAWNRREPGGLHPVLAAVALPGQRLWWVNGSAAGGNWDIGLFTINGSKLYAAGSTAGSGNSVPQFVVARRRRCCSRRAGTSFGMRTDATTANQCRARRASARTVCG